MFGQYAVYGLGSPVRKLPYCPQSHVLFVKYCYILKCVLTCKTNTNFEIINDNIWFKTININRESILAFIEKG